jgi:hypothetical protein
VVALIKDPMLVVWEAMNLLAEVRVSPDTTGISKMLAEAETALFDIVSALAQRANNKGLISTPTVITPRLDSVIPLPTGQA